MARVVSLQGKAKGKVGSMVYSVNAGQLIAREYQPNVANPNTVAQTNQRASFKLLAQMAAALAPVIAIPKDGMKSPRNLFIKFNSNAVSADDGIAQMTYENVQLTNGNAGLPAIEATRSAESGISIHLADRCDAAISRIVYILYKKTSEKKLQLVQSIVVTAAGANGNFPATLIYTEGDIVLFAYGMKDLNAKASAKYANYNVSNGQDIATLVLNRSISLSDYQFTMTRGTTMFAGENTTIVVPEGSARVFLTPSGNGTVSGAGVFVIGTNVTVVATPGDGATFVGWKLNGSDTYVSRNASYTFALNGQTDLIAVFRTEGQASSYFIEVQNSNASVGTVEPLGEQEVTAGDSITLKATATSVKASFDGWFVDNSRLSSSATYTLTPQDDMTIEARWIIDSED